MNLALLITMYNEGHIVSATIKNVAGQLNYIGIIQSGDVCDERVLKAFNEFQSPRANGCSGSFTTAENLGDQYPSWEIPARAICRNYSLLFSELEKDEQEPDWIVAITGDTLLLDLRGIESIIRNMESHHAIIGCAQAQGQDFHSADLTLDDLKAGKGGGRMQGNVNDFMPQLFIVRGDAQRDYKLFENIKVTNRWCSEQCLGDELERRGPVSGARLWMEQYIFAANAYDFADGVIYNAAD